MRWHFLFTGLRRKIEDNIEDHELAALKLLASQMLSYDDRDIAKAIESGTLIEVTRHEKDKAVS